MDTSTCENTSTCRNTDACGDDMEQDVKLI